MRVKGTILSRLSPVYRGETNNLAFDTLSSTRLSFSSHATDNSIIVH